MAHDLVIRGGEIVDGTGSAPVRGDVAITDGRVTHLGDVTGSGRREIDAEGHLVTPGFVDIHTHLDAQIAWDPVGTSSSWHGVTSVVLGNCGVTFAPCKPADRRFLAEMMESVEDIPADAIMNGLPWTWETYGEYLTALDVMPKGMNVGGMVGHCALRVHAMGERGLSSDPDAATAEDIANMAAMVREAMSAGAMGFSTSRTLLHVVPDGRNVPGTFAGENELMAFADELGRAKAGVYEVAPRFENDRDGSLTDNEIGWMAEVSRRSGRPVTFGLAQSDRKPQLYAEIIDLVTKHTATGGVVHPQSTARGIGVLLGFTHRTPFDSVASWRALRSLPLADKVSVLRDPARRAELVADADAASIPMDFGALFVLGITDAHYVPTHESSLAAHASRLGMSVANAFIELSLESDGRRLFNFPFLNQNFAAVQYMLDHPVVVLGLADSGAHVGQIMDASQPTWLLTYWVRERQHMLVEEAIRRLTSEPAALFGVKDRGVLRPGACADVNIIDLDAMRLPVPEYVHDFPNGAGRYIQKATGYRATIVNGAVFMEHGEHTGALAGTVLRSTDR